MQLWLVGIFSYCLNTEKIMGRDKEQRAHGREIVEDRKEHQRERESRERESRDWAWQMWFTADAASVLPGSLGLMPSASLVEFPSDLCKTTSKFLPLGSGEQRDLVVRAYWWLCTRARWFVFFYFWNTVLLLFRYRAYCWQPSVWSVFDQALTLQIRLHKFSQRPLCWGASLVTIPHLRST